MVNHEFIQNESNSSEDWADEFIVTEKLPAEEMKLFNPRTAEGEPNWQVLKVLREMNEELTQRFESYVGAALTGSQMRGYSNEYSDIDIVFTVDVSIEDDQDECLDYLRQRLKKDFQSVNEISLHVLVTEISPEIIASDMESLSENIHDEEAVKTIAVLSDLIVGDRIGQYREQIHSTLATFSDKEKRIIYRNVANRMRHFHELEIYKVQKRTENMAFDKNQYISDKVSLWKGRLERLWGTTVA